MLRNSFATTAETPKMGGATAVAVDVFASARLHLGFLDLDGALGRRFGSLGVAIDGLPTRLAVVRAPRPDATGPSAARALDYVALTAAALRISPDVKVTIAEASPAHAGLGSGTQIALAIGTAMAKLNGIDVPPAELARKLGRGARSGVGIGLFERGGFILDGGRRDEGGAAPIVARLAFPTEWRFLLVLDPERRGLHGEAETTAFAALPRFDETLAGHLCRQVLLRLMPGLVEHDFDSVSQAIGDMQGALGDYYSKVQKGRYTSKYVEGALGYLASRGIAGVGQSSWGPTGFALIESDAEAETILRELRAKGSNLEFHVVSGTNRGAEISIR
jgi:beta-ribofuranosylaminobenzene 5'-phosphate synthase